MKLFEITAKTTPEEHNIFYVVAENYIDAVNLFMENNKGEIYKIESIAHPVILKKENNAEENAEIKALTIELFDLFMYRVKSDSQGILFDDEKIIVKKYGELMGEEKP